MEEKEKKVQKLIGFTTKEKVGLGALLVLIVAAPILTTQLGWIVDFTGTGEIGDTIGGITAPFVNLLAAYLVYKSFTAQIRANAQQRSDHDEQMNQLKKEHTFNYISNLFKLAKDYYYNNNIDSTSKTIFISNIYKIAKITRNKIEDDYKHGIEGKDYEDKAHDELIEYANHQIISQLIKVKSNLDNMYDFVQVLNKTELEHGLKKFYYREIERMLYHMRIWKLSDKDYLEVLEEYDIIQKSSRKIIDECIQTVNNIFMSGIKLAKIRDYTEKE